MFRNRVGWTNFLVKKTKQKKPNCEENANFQVMVMKIEAIKENGGL